VVAGGGEFEIPTGSGGEGAGSFWRSGAVAAAVKGSDGRQDFAGEARDVSREDNVVEAASVAVVAVVESAADDGAGLAGDKERSDREPKRAEALEAGATDV